MKLIEGIDYYKEEDRIVFTKEFLLKRGHCCNSRCRNCPYTQPAEKKNSIRIRNNIIESQVVEKEDENES